jgi:hypothetical protein
MKRIEKSLSKHTRKLTALDTLVKGARIISDAEAFKRLLPQFTKELKVQKSSKLSTEGYTNDELTYIEYCLSRLGGGRRAAKAI